ncbi:hypothetical protein B484DRAFT_425520 [Ochromonadaceae sp. CCMP2298]|nr:hypothetical protein B484DRAFT_425520 [Ochromonadaceae sp. CCMP2298]
MEGDDRPLGSQGSVALRSSTDDTDEPEREAMYFGKEYERPGQVSAGIDLKRFVTYNLLAVALALGANFLGVTSALMSTNPTFFRSLGVDQSFPSFI